MKQLALLFGKIFIIASVAFGFLIMLVFSVVPSLFAHIFALVTKSDPIYLSMSMGWQEVRYFLGVGVLYGAPMALILGLSQYFSVLRVAKGKPLDLSPIQHRALVLNSPSITIFEYSMQFLQTIKARIIESNPLENHITARTKTSWWNPWGDDIRINVIPTNGKETRVEITSCPSLKTALIDYGSSYKNVEEFISTINRIVS
jgi:hypothetical protein